MSIRVSHLNKRFGNFVAVDDGFLEVESGELVAFLGPSDCGNSTIFASSLAWKPLIPAPFTAPARPPTTRIRVRAGSASCSSTTPCSAT